MSKRTDRARILDDAGKLVAYLPYGRALRQARDGLLVPLRNKKFRRVRLASFSEFEEEQRYTAGEWLPAMTKPSWNGGQPSSSAARRTRKPRASRDEAAAHSDRFCRDHYQDHWDRRNAI